MSPRPALSAVSAFPAQKTWGERLRADRMAQEFSTFSKLMAETPLHELTPAGPGAGAAALGFGLALAAQWSGSAGIVWAGEANAFAEDGAPYPPGLTQFGLDLSKLIVVRARKREEALWAGEQALAITGAIVLCSLGAGGKPLDLKATRRLLLSAERHQSRCLLLRAEAEASAAWTRWRIGGAASAGEARELGPPAFRAELMRNRGGPVGQSFVLDWNAHERRFSERGALAGAVSAAPGDGSADPIRACA